MSYINTVKSTGKCLLSNKHGSCVALPWVVYSDVLWGFLKRYCHRGIHQNYFRKKKKKKKIET